MNTATNQSGLNRTTRAMLHVMSEYHRLRASTIPAEHPMQEKIRPLGKALKELSREIYAK